MSRGLAPGAMPVLSSSARSRVDWQRITDTFGMLGPMRSAGAAPEGASAPLTEADRTRLREALSLVQSEFGKALSGLKRVMSAVVVAIVVALALAIAGGVLLQLTPYAGVVSLASVGTLAGLLIKMWNLARDQAMLELIPARYALAVQLCQTQQDARDLIARFLTETSSFRGEAPAKAG